MPGNKRNQRKLASRLYPTTELGFNTPAAKRRKIKAHGASRGFRNENDSAPEGRKNSVSDTLRTTEIFSPILTSAAKI
jgi:hypothetical protein